MQQLLVARAQPLLPVLEAAVAVAYVEGVRFCLHQASHLRLLGPPPLRRWKHWHSLRHRRSAPVGRTRRSCHLQAAQRHPRGLPWHSVHPPRRPRDLCLVAPRAPSSPPRAPVLQRPRQPRRWRASPRRFLLSPPALLQQLHAQLRESPRASRPALSWPPPSAAFANSWAGGHPGMPRSPQHWWAKPLPLQSSLCGSGLGRGQRSCLRHLPRRGHWTKPPGGCCRSPSSRARRCRQVARLRPSASQRRRCDWACAPKPPCPSSAPPRAGQWHSYGGPAPNLGGPRSRRHYQGLARRATLHEASARGASARLEALPAGGASPPRRLIHTVEALHTHQEATSPARGARSVQEKPARSASART